MLGWSRIGCGTDFSEPSRIAMLKAAALARLLEGELELVHVHTPPAAAGTELPLMPEQDRAMTLVDLEREMATWREEAERVVGRPVRSSVLAGDAAGEIARLARQRPFDLVVVGTHGRRGLKRLFLGSVAERVVREADCAMLVVRREEDED